MKLQMQDLKQATRSMRLIDLDHVNDMGKLAFRMGIDRTANPYKDIGHDAWTRGYDHAKRGWEDLLRRNGVDGVRKTLWMGA
jgi:hypothetical protein